MIGTTSSGTLIVLFGMYICYIRTLSTLGGRVVGRRSSLAATAKLDASVEFVDQRIVERDVQTHVPTLAHSSCSLAGCPTTSGLSTQVEPVEFALEHALGAALGPDRFQQRIPTDDLGDP